MVNALRAEVGQAPMAIQQTPSDYLVPAPPWFDPAAVRTTLVESADTSPARMPILGVLKSARDLAPGEAVVLETPFLPAPGIDLLRRKGLEVWSTASRAGWFRTFVAQPPTQ